MSMTAEERCDRIVYMCALPLWANSLWSFEPNCIFCLVRRKCAQRACRFSNTDDIWNRNGQRCSRFPFRRVVVGNKRNESATRTRTAPHIHTRARRETAMGNGGVGELLKCARSVDRHGRRRHTHTRTLKWCEHDDHGGG